MTRFLVATKCKVTEMTRFVVAPYCLANSLTSLSHDAMFVSQVMSHGVTNAQTL